MCVCVLYTYLTLKQLISRIVLCGDCGKIGVSENNREKKLVGLSRTVEGSVHRTGDSQWQGRLVKTDLRTQALELVLLMAGCTTEAAFVGRDNKICF